MSFFAVKDVWITPTNREELKLNQLIIMFNNPEYCSVGTIINPNIPDGLSNMYDF
jgi:hypothetical protein